jgi:phytoene dehydrogenase-like protein
MPKACVIGSGPNGLAAAITLARAGVATTVFERNARVGGGCSTGQTTLPGFRHDLGSSVYPMGRMSPFFRSLPVKVPWIDPGAPCAHPLDDGTVVMLERSIAETVDQLDPVDRVPYQSLIEPLAEGFSDLLEDVLAPMLHLPKHPLLMARFGMSGILSASALAGLRFKGTRARALFAGVAAHAVQALESPMTSAVGLLLMAAAHSSGWPIVRGGAQTLTDAMAGYLKELGGSVETELEVDAVRAAGSRLFLSATDLNSSTRDQTSEECELALGDVTPSQLLRMAGGALTEGYRRELAKFRYGAGVFKVDYALSEPIPWVAKACLRSATVHLGGTFEEIANSERTFSSERPFVLLVQPSLFDETRAPEGKHTAWAYIHVPNGSTRDWLPLLEAQIERFAPGFAECVLARSVMAPAALERWNPNLVGGDISGGVMTPWQMLFRPSRSLYRTSVNGLYLCGSSTPPGGGVHGMAGFHAATRALKDLI